MWVCKHCFLLLMLFVCGGGGGVGGLLLLGVRILGVLLMVLIFFQEC